MPRSFKIKRPRCRPGLCRALASGTLLALAACEPPLVPCAVPPPLPDGVTVHLTEAPYEVRGHSVSALDASLRARGPSHDGEPALALTTWRVGWTGRPQSDEDGCGLVDVRVAVTVAITLPEWCDRDDASSELVARWDGFLEALRAHENRHRDRALTAGAAVHETLVGTRAADCDAVDALARQRAAEALRRHRELDAAYDRLSERGRTEGAAWPPSGP